MAEGWIAIDRKIQDHWLWKSFPFSYGQAWIDLLLLANHEATKIPYKGEMIVCERGTVNRSIKYLADRWHWDRKTTRKFLLLLERDEMVITKATRHRTTITIVNYDNFQHIGTTKRTTKCTSKSQQSPNKLPIYNNDNNDNNYILTDIICRLNEKTGKKFSPESSVAKRCINARLKEGYKTEDFYKVIDIKVSKWLNDENMNQYLRPETLFGTKFESYLNEKGASEHEVATTGRLYADVGIDCNQ